MPAGHRILCASRSQDSAERTRVDSILSAKILHPLGLRIPSKKQNLSRLGQWQGKFGEFGKSCVFIEESREDIALARWFDFIDVGVFKWLSRLKR